MPELHHLQLLGNNITIDGILVNFENCHLESLDTRESFFADLGPNIEMAISADKGSQAPQMTPLRTMNLLMKLVLSILSYIDSDDQDLISVYNKFSGGSDIDSDKVTFSDM
ncbi:hypothetical protein POM88_006380 [Heracleum sosnowskyi]|uniref:Uncharacterized protein n=1 Tax=Heracleum sosnowskyi TaxID=360622 RepID=A0AAD8J2I6_9APIA|nr:hypothetical protein POM88_006380 [Heracleum sosnowskyi]